MEISEKAVEEAALLARLAVTPEERRLYRGQLEKILESMAELKALDTSGVTPTAHALGPMGALREDEPRLFPDPQSLLEAAPAREGPYFKVPKVIE